MDSAALSLRASELMDETVQKVTFFMCPLCKKLTAGRKEKDGVHPRKHWDCPGTKELARQIEVEVPLLKKSHATLLAEIDAMIDYQIPKSGVIRLNKAEFNQFIEARTIMGKMNDDQIQDYRGVRIEPIDQGTE